MHPEAAVQSHKDLGATTMLPMHWATFNLAYHAWAEPIERAMAAANAQGVQRVAPRGGERGEFGAGDETRVWWVPK